ncbi:MAG: hypothetical protein HY695_38010 [Deltaproteobacteria bacterium]|nr:hypothetical protein [Deltaproteobacteria bacterium]
MGLIIRGRVSKNPCWMIGTLLFTLLVPDAGLSRSSFYEGKTITIIQGRNPGGTGDLRVKALIPFLQKYIPGNPVIVSQYMPGGGGRKSANHIYKTARPDGLTIGNVSTGAVPAAVLRKTGILYDLDKLIYVGSPYSANHYVFVTRKEAGLRTLEKLRSAPGVRIGGQSVGHDIYYIARIFAYLIGLKDPKFITGYSGPEMDLALLRGELDGRVNTTETVIRRNADWLEKGLMDFHAVIEIPSGNRHPRFPHLPELESFAKSTAEKKLLSVFRTFQLMGAPYVLPPGTPEELVEIIQEAMRKSFRDPDFHKEYKKLTGEDASPMTPEAMTRSIKDIPRDPEVVELFKKLADAGPLPPR